MYNLEPAMIVVLIQCHITSTADFEYACRTMEAMWYTVRMVVAAQYSHSCIVCANSVLIITATYKFS